MIRILHNVHKMVHGGIQSLIMNVYRNIDRSKVQFDFMTSEGDTAGDYDEEINSLGGRIYQVPRRKQGVLKSIRGINAFFRKHPEYRIIHAHMSSLTNVSSLRIAKQYGVPCRIVHGHNTKQGGGSLHKYFHHLNQYTINSYATDFFVCSTLAAKWMYPKRQYEKHGYRVINNGIEVEKFAFNKEKRNEKRNQLGIENKFVIGHVGRFHPQKNHDFLIDIFKTIHDINNNSILLLVGDGELRPQIEQKVKTLGLTESVILIGVRSDIPELLQAMDVFVFPSYYEGLGIALVEAQASGLKCFTSDKVVPEEVNVTSLVKFMALENSAQIWAEEVLSSKDYTRVITTDSIKNAGYDIRQIAEDLQKWYELKAKAIQ